MKVTFEIDLSQLDPARLAEVQHALSVLLGIGDSPKSKTAAPSPTEHDNSEDARKKAMDYAVQRVKSMPPEQMHKKVMDYAVEHVKSLTPSAPEKVAEVIMQDAAPDAEVSLDAIRAVMRDKVNDYRNEIRSELKRLGAAKVTALQPERYGEFHTFLMQLGEAPF